MYMQKTLQKVVTNQCTIEVFGLGYVGFPLAVRLASSNFRVIGVDTDQSKINNLKNKSLPATHTTLKPEFLESMKNGNFVPSEKPLSSDQPKIGIVCVPTPVNDKNNNSGRYVYSAVESFLDIANKGDVIILESSVRVGTTEKIIEMIESQGYHIGHDFGVCFCPERIDPLNQKWKLENIPRVIFSSDDTTFEIAQRIYEHVNNSNLFRVYSAKVAEVVKSFENAFRLVNISLVNELAVLCDKLKINVNEVIEAASTKPFGFMPHYPGAGAGGHCVPKDPRFLLESAKENGLRFLSIETALEVNTLVPKYVVETIEKTLRELKLKRSVLVCGLSYKPDIEDMRDSPGFKILSELHQKKFKIGAYDPHFKHELLEKYLIENHIGKFDFDVLHQLSDDAVKRYSCICIVQHHSQTKSRIEEIYKSSVVPLIYDCRNKIVYRQNSKTVLNSLGFVSYDSRLLSRPLLNS